MPVDLTLTDAGYMHVNMHGVVTAQDFLKYTLEAEALEAKQPVSLHRITDLTSVEHFELHYEDVFKLANRRRRQQLTRPVKSAILVCTPVQLGMARMFQTIGDSELVQIEVVKSLAEALAWIGVTPPPAAEE